MNENSGWYETFYRDQNRENIGLLLKDTYQVLSKAFKGGKQRQRDRDFGIKDPDFWKWWERQGKKKKRGKGPNKGPRSGHV
jgi:hypothetical protein